MFIVRLFDVARVCSLYLSPVIVNEVLLVRLLFRVVLNSPEFDLDPSTPPF